MSGFKIVFSIFCLCFFSISLYAQQESLEDKTPAAFPSHISFRDISIEVTENKLAAKVFNTPLYLSSEQKDLAKAGSKSLECDLLYDHISVISSDWQLFQSTQQAVSAAKYNTSLYQALKAVLESNSSQKDLEKNLEETIIKIRNTKLPLKNPLVALLQSPECFASFTDMLLQRIKNYTALSKEDFRSSLLLLLYKKNIHQLLIGHKVDASTLPVAKDETVQGPAEIALRMSQTSTWKINTQQKLVQLHPLRSFQLLGLPSGLEIKVEYHPVHYPFQLAYIEDGWFVSFTETTFQGSTLAAPCTPLLPHNRKDIETLNAEQAETSEVRPLTFRHRISYPLWREVSVVKDLESVRNFKAIIFSDWIITNLGNITARFGEDTPQPIFSSLLNNPPNSLIESILESFFSFTQKEIAKLLKIRAAIKEALEAQGFIMPESYRNLLSLDERTDYFRHILPSKAFKEAINYNGPNIDKGIDYLNATELDGLNSWLASNFEMLDLAFSLGDRTLPTTWELLLECLDLFHSQKNHVQFVKGFHKAIKHAKD